MPAIELLQELLRVDSTNPPGNETPAAELLEAHLARVGLETKLYASPSGRTSLVARLDGPTDVPALVLLSHSDVVGVERESWTRDPFGGEIADGAVWGRGTLDMKSIAVMHAEAVASLVASGATPRREVVVVVAADEEAGGSEGTGWLVDNHPDRLGFGEERPPPEVLGEGGYGLSGVLDRAVMPIVLGEKSALSIALHARGDPGHGSLPPRHQAVLNLVRLLERVCGERSPRVHPVMREQFALLGEAALGGKAALFKALASGAGGGVARLAFRQLRAAGAIGLLLADTVTPTRLGAGYKDNVVPGEANASLDCRLLPDTDVDGFVRALTKEAASLGTNVEVVRRTSSPVTAGGPLFEVIRGVSARLPGAPVVVPSLTPGMTDIRFFRERGAAGYGWVPAVLAPELLGTIHGHDERIPVDAFHEGVSAMSEAVSEAAGS